MRTSSCTKPIAITSCDTASTDTACTDTLSSTGSSCTPPDIYQTNSTNKLNRSTGSLRTPTDIRQTERVNSQSPLGDCEASLSAVQDSANLKQSTQYIGRFAPSPSGSLHNGSLVAAMSSYLDARAHRGRWLLRIEDIDTPRVIPGADTLIMQQLQQLGMHWDEEPIWQSQCLSRYEQAFNELQAHGLIYGCSCTRKEIADSAIALGLHEQGQYPYTGTCRRGTNKPVRAWRLRMPEGIFSFEDRWLGLQQQDIQAEVGDIIIKRADGLFAYQLVVVLDDAFQGITDIVRGQDLMDSTERQICIANYFDFKIPRYMHVPLVCDEQGRKLSKQNHAHPIDTKHALSSLTGAWQALGFAPFVTTSVESFWTQATALWAQRFKIKA